jgi:stage III sporulation protein AG
MEREKKSERFRKLWDQYKFVGLIVLIGAVLLLWPSGNRKNAAQNTTAAPQAADQTAETLEETEGKMEAILSKIDGVGNLQLMLTVESGAEEHYAQDTELSYSGATSAPDDYTRKSETVIVSGDEGDAPVVTQSSSPVYRGALVVCQGAGNAEVKLAVTQAVAALTGLSSDRITVLKCQ